MANRSRGPVAPRGEEVPTNVEEAAGDQIAAAAAAVVADIEAKSGESTPTVATCPHGQPEGECAMCALDDAAPADPVDVPDADLGDDAEPEAEDAGLSDEEWDEFVAAAPDDVDFPLDEGEEVMAQRSDEDGDTFVLTNFGRRIGVSADGWITTLIGPDITVAVPPTPTNPSRKRWNAPA